MLWNMNEAYKNSRWNIECEMWHVDWDSRDFEPPSSPHFHRRLESGPQSARMPKYCVFSTAPIHR